MRAIHLKLHWPSEAEIASYLRRLGSQDVEIGVGTAAWAGLIFAIVHFGGGTV
jgi:hypothetical protein